LDKKLVKKEEVRMFAQNTESMKEFEIFKGELKYESDDSPRVDRERMLDPETGEYMRKTEEGENNDQK